MHEIFGMGYLGSCIHCERKKSCFGLIFVVVNYIPVKIKLNRTQESKNNDD